MVDKFFFVSRWASKLHRLTMSKRMYVFPGTKQFCSGCNCASWVFCWLTSKKNMDSCIHRYKGVIVSDAGLKQRCFLSCTKYTCCSADCFPKSNCSLHIFMKSLDCMLIGICVLLRSGYVKNMLSCRVFPDSEI